MGEGRVSGGRGKRVQEEGAHECEAGMGLKVGGGDLRVEGSQVDVGGSRVNVEGRGVDREGSRVDGEGSRVDVEGRGVDVEGRRVDVVSTILAEFGGGGSHTKTGPPRPKMGGASTNENGRRLSDQKCRRGAAWCQRYCRTILGIFQTIG